MTDAISNRKDRDLQQLHDSGCDNLSSGQVMAKIAGDAGVQKMAIRGDDKSYDELIAEYKGAKANIAGSVEMGLHGVEVGGDVIGIHVLESGVFATGAAAALPVVGLGAGLWELREVNVRGEALSRAVAKDEEHVAMLTHLDLPESFKRAELAKYPEVGTTFASANQKMATQMAGQDRPLVLALQVQCDHGMNAAMDMSTSGLSRDAFMTANPSLAKRYADDAAFKAGFDAVTNTPKDSAEYKTMESALQQRDASYARANITMRG